MYVLPGQTLQVRLVAALLQDLTIAVSFDDADFGTGATPPFDPSNVVVVTDGAAWVDLLTEPDTGRRRSVKHLGTFNPNESTAVLLFRYLGSAPFMRRVIASGAPLTYLIGVGWSDASDSAGGVDIIGDESIVGTGELLISGGPDIHFPFVLPVTGGELVISGEAAEAEYHVGSGEVLISGPGLLLEPFPLVGSGEVLISGGPEIIQLTQITGSGELLISGSAEDDRPFHQWFFNENAGSTAADTGVGPPITITSIDDWTDTDLAPEPGGNVSAARLPRGGKFLIPGDLLDDWSGDFTITGRIRIGTPAFGTFSTIGILYPSATPTGFYVLLGMGDLDFHVKWSGQDFDTGETFPGYNTWVQWAVRRTASTNLVEFLLDAVVVASQTFTGDPPASATYETEVVSSNDLDVDFDDTVVWKRLVDDAELAARLAPNYLFQDTFLGTTGTAITAHTPETGQTWAAGGAGWTIQTNKLQQTAGGGAWLATWVDLGETEGTLTVTVTTPTTGTFALGILARVGGTNASQNIGLRFSNDGNTFGMGVGNGLRLCRAVGNTEDNNAVPTGTVTTNTTYTVELEVTGNNFVAKVNGTTVGSGTYTDFASNTKWGLIQFIGSGYSTCTIDDMTVA